MIYCFLRRKKDIDVINDNDDAIAKMITDMRIAAKEDRELNDLGSPCIKKTGMLRHVMVTFKPLSELLSDKLCVSAQPQQGGAPARLHRGQPAVRHD